MNLAELARLAAGAANSRSHWWVEGPTEVKEFIDACTPERIAALVRVAEAAKPVVIPYDGHTVFNFDHLRSLAVALRDLEATP